MSLSRSGYRVYQNLYLLSEQYEPFFLINDLRRFTLARPARALMHHWRIGQPFLLGLDIPLAVLEYGCKRCG